MKITFLCVRKYFIDEIKGWKIVLLPIDNEEVVANGSVGLAMSETDAAIFQEGSNFEITTTDAVPI